MVTMSGSDYTTDRSYRKGQIYWREGVPNSRETNEVKITYSVFGGKTWHNLFDVEDLLLEQLNLRNVT